MSDSVDKFDTGATRQSNAGKYEVARFLDPVVLSVYCAYMHKHRLLPDGSLREPDNWKKGIPKQRLMDSLVRHMLDIWVLHETGYCFRPEDGSAVGYVETLCAILFNTMAYLREHLKEMATMHEGRPPSVKAVSDPGPMAFQIYTDEKGVEHTQEVPSIQTRRRPRVRF